MLTCPTYLPIDFCTTPVDFRKSFDGLTGVITAVFGSSVLDSHLFLFINKRRDRSKAIWWDPDGVVIACKRLDWVSAADHTAESDGVVLCVRRHLSARTAGQQ